MKISGILLCGVAALLSACSTGTTKFPRSTNLQASAYETQYLGANGRVVTVQTKAGKNQEAGYWKGEGVAGAPSIVINLSEQQAFFYKGGQLVGAAPISSGREGYRTPTGSFRIIQKNANHFSNLYGDYVDASGAVVVRNVGVMEDPRPPGTRFQGAPMPYFMRIVNGVGMHAGFLPGVPDSHGCIRLPKDMAQIFFANAPSGTPVQVTH